jgi:hypothetical protein
MARKRPSPMSFADAYGIADDLDLPDGAAFALASELSGRDFYDDDDEAVYCPTAGGGSPARRTCASTGGTSTASDSHHAPGVPSPRRDSPARRSPTRFRRALTGQPAHAPAGHGAAPGPEQHRGSRA